jgi:antitoxin (DNA-binding transcriptional repressor) of toxin-antitoxin stability system
MPQSERVRVRLQALDERLARLRMDKNRLIARVSQAERKRDTRRKILIGGAVLAAIDHEGVPALRSRAELLRWLDARLTRPHDRSVFDLTPHETTRTGLQPSADSRLSARSEAAVKDADHREAPPSGAQRP